MSKIWVTGEALIDFVPTSSDQGPAFAPRCGGSTFNAAKAACLQGADVGFLGAISTDMFGDMLADDLSAHGVDIADAPRVDHPTTLAFVDFSSGSPRYAFFNALTATQLMEHDGSRFNPEPGDILQAGSISLIDNPGADNTAEFVRGQADRVLVSLDPNARPGMVPDIQIWRDRIQSLIDVAGIVKMSDEDIESFAPGIAPADFADRLVSKGVGLAVVTLGAGGAIAATSSGKASVPARRGDLVDTVGAGDTVTGTLLAQLLDQGATTKENLSSLGDDMLGVMLQRCMTAASQNCATSGCNPPKKEETDRLMAETMA